ncbi:uncharacterized protein LOC125823371 [Solanum verrucosum]|uniref:uncharacterized protein LOC125823371 n=1 Tax=Solanum verrucosum TaxID=315347 RepID=UPI0020D1C8CD|nr:uncharacterized protein LOC125823371 [Solanum verrucosum]
MPFGLKNVGATYMRSMTTIFHDMIHKEIKVNVDDVIIKSRESLDHLTHLRKFFDRLRRYNLKLNLTKCAFGVPAMKMLGFIVSRRGIELEPSKIKAIQELPPLKTKKKVMSFLGRLNYISRFITQSTVVCEPIFKLLKKGALTKWIVECQTVSDDIKNYLSNLLVLVPPQERSTLLLFLSISDNTFGCVLGRHDKTGKKERAIYYLSKKFTPYEKAIKAQALADHLAENPVDEEYEPLNTYFSDEEVAFVGEDILEAYPGWKVFFDGAPNHQGKGIRVVLVSESGQHYPMAAKLRFDCTYNMVEYEACILGLKMVIDINVHELLVIGDSNLLIHQVQGEWAVKNPKITPYVQYIQKLCKRLHKIEFRHILRTQNELADALATIASMIKHLDISYIDPVDIEVKEKPVHCSHVKTEPDGLQWYFDIKKYLETGTYPENATFNQKKSICRMANNFFPSGEILYKKTPKLGLLICVDASEAVKLLEQIHAGVCGTQMNGLTLATWRMDVTGPIEPAASNGHKFSLVVIDYFTKWMETTSYKSVIKKVIADFVRNNLICRTTVRTSIGAIPYLLVYGTKAIIPTEVEIPSLRIIQEAELSDADWDEYKGKFTPNWQGPYMVCKVLSGGALVLSEMDGTKWPKLINSDVVKRYYM